MLSPSCVPRLSDTFVNTGFLSLVQLSNVLKHKYLSYSAHL